MDTSGLSPVEHRVCSLEDAALQRLVALEEDEWTEEAMGVARDELSRRGLPVLNRDDYLIEHPEDEVRSDGLCGQCASDGFPVFRWDPVLLMFIGIRVIPTSEPCEVCRSQVIRMWWPLIPLIPLDTYRMLS